MTRFLTVLLFAFAGLTACAPIPETQTLAADGMPLPKVYRIAARDEAKIQYRILDSINALRGASGSAQVSLNANLTAAAATHARDMFVQNRPWHFGSDGSSPIVRVARSGYTGLMIGETISETYETELQTLSAWMDQPDTREIILDSRATDIGFAWHQENNGKLWWVLVVGGSGSAPIIPLN